MEKLIAELSEHFGGNTDGMLDVNIKQKHFESELCSSFIKFKEEVVHALWEFAHELQVSKNLNTARSDGTKMDLDAVEKALRSILAIFNVEITEVQ